MSRGAAPIVFPPSGFPADGESVSKCRGRLRGTVACPERGEDTLNFTSSDGLARSQSGHCPQGQNFFQKIVRALVVILVIDAPINSAGRGVSRAPFSDRRPKFRGSICRRRGIGDDRIRTDGTWKCPSPWRPWLREYRPTGTAAVTSDAWFPFALTTCPCLKLLNVIDPLIRSSWMMRRPSVRCGRAHGSTPRSSALKATGLAHAQLRICRGKFMARQC